MYRTGHYGAALLAFAPVAYLLLSIGEPALAVVAGGGMLWLAMLPDVDHRLPLVSHRGPTHSLGFAGLVGGAFAGVGLLLGSAMGFETVAGIGLGAFGFIVGAVAVVAHLLADVITPAGAPLLWPLSGRRYSLDLARADNVVWNYGLFVVGVFAVSAVVAVSVVGVGV
ncbi:metal-dependent hydrolase [Halobium salinum]|uniref:Metal-dependent hydrolase n=1 Tax=Halobium salinum TaxID=1364940 RepID=A0ABD5P7C3_9EURY|nr:metal-dependent hydrolase [Halobium salinum]